jgi:hypothetical protein
MLKLISILLALLPVFLLLRALFGRSRAVKQAVSEVRRQIDFLVWVILAIIAVAIAYSLVALLLPFWK